MERQSRVQGVGLAVLPGGAHTCARAGVTSVAGKISAAASAPMLARKWRRDSSLSLRSITNSLSIFPLDHTPGKGTPSRDLLIASDAPVQNVSVIFETDGIRCFYGKASCSGCMII